MPVTLIEGNMGAGKTLMATTMALAYKAEGYRCFANYATKLADVRLTTVEQLIQVEHGVLVIDEVSFLFDSRSFMKNVDLTQWFMLTRKAGLEVIMTTQSFANIDSRLRRVTDYLITMTWLPPLLGQSRSRAEVFMTFPYLHRVRKFLFNHDARLYSLYDTYDRSVYLARPEPEKKSRSRA